MKKIDVKIRLYMIFFIINYFNVDKFKTEK